MWAWEFDFSLPVAAREGMGGLLCVCVRVSGHVKVGRDVKAQDGVKEREAAIARPRNVLVVVVGVRKGERPAARNRRERARARLREIARPMRYRRRPLSSSAVVVVGRCRRRYDTEVRRSRLLSRGRRGYEVGESSPSLSLSLVRAAVAGAWRRRACVRFCRFACVAWVAKSRCWPQGLVDGDCRQRKQQQVAGSCGAWRGAKW
jgi:hypothetical protein